MVFAVPHDTVLISDGGLATELEARGHDLSDDLWSARLLVDAPREIAAVHARSSAPERCSPPRRAIRRRSTVSRRAESAATTPLGCCGAASSWPRTARDEVGGDGRWVAASVGPYGAALANGEEYVGRYGLSVAAAGRLASAAAGGPRRRRARRAGARNRPRHRRGRGAGRRWCGELGVPAWLSATPSTGRHTRAGQPLADAFAVAAGVPEIVAVGVNCCAPADVVPAIAVARDVTGKPVDRLPEQRRGLGRRAAGRGSDSRGGRPS